MTVAAPVLNTPVGLGTMDDPYKFGPRVPAPPITRTIPAKGTAVGIVATSGIAHALYGLSATPRVVDKLDPPYVYLTDPAGLHRFSLHLSDPWELLPAADCHFFTRCRKCEGLGEHHVGKGDVCATCNGERVVRRKRCTACDGRGRSAGKGVILACLDCAGWGINLQQPFSGRNIRRAKREHAARSATT